MRKVADNFVNYQARALEFAVGDVVVPFGFLDSQVGRVTAVWPAIGMVDVELPTGNRRFPVENLQRFQNGVAQPPSAGMNTAPGESRTVPVSGGPGRVASALGDSTWKMVERIADLPFVRFTDFESSRAIRVEWDPNKAPPLEEIKVQLKDLVRASSQAVGGFDDVTRNGLTVVLKGGEDSSARMASSVRQALYWASENRKYNLTRAESEGNFILCPRCKTSKMKKAIYKREESKSVHLYGCKRCLFLIRRDDIVNHPEVV